MTKAAANAIATTDALSWLNDNPTARNLVMSVGPDRVPAYTTKQVLDAHIGPHAHDGVSFTPIQPSITEGPTLSHRRVKFFMECVLPFIWPNYPSMMAKCPSFCRYGAKAFSVNILGPENSKPSFHLKYPELHRRMQLADAAFLADPTANRPKSSHALAWQTDSTSKLDKRQILIDGSATWHPELQLLLSHQYLDVLAGVTTSLPNLSSAPTKTKVDHVQLKDYTDPRRSLGSVFHVQDCFSPEFLAMAMDTGIPTLPFMRDGMKTGKDRLSRVPYDVPGAPFRLRKENPFLMLSDTSCIFEAHMLKIGNFVNAHLHQHLKRYVEANHGKKAVDIVVPPLVVFRMIQSSLNSLGAGGYAMHDDSGTFVTDNHLNYGDEDHNMLVPTFFWSNRTDVATKVSWAQKGMKKNKGSILTTSGGFHYQAYGVQMLQVHWTEPPIKKRAKDSKVAPISKDDHRFTQSLRSTLRFQELHHKVLYASKPDILSVGAPSDYNFRIRLGDVTERNSLMGTPIRPNDPTANNNAEPSRYFTTAVMKQAGLNGNAVEGDSPDASTGDGTTGDEHVDPCQSRFLDVTTPRFPSPIEIYGNYPLGHDRYLKSPCSPHQFFSSGAGLQRLLKLRISPIVHLSEENFPAERATQVNYGFAMEHRDNDGVPRPVKPGRVYAASAVYRNLGLSSSMTDSQVWHTDHEQLVGTLLARGYKSEFPESSVLGRGPLVDYRRLVAGLQPLGFWTGGGGGAPSLIGEISAPDLQKATSLEAAVLEQAQKVTSARNLAMLQAAQRQAWIQIYLTVGSGGIIPEIEVRYMDTLSEPLRGSSMKKVVLLGTYEIDHAVYRRYSTADLEQFIAFQENLPSDSTLKMPGLDAEFKRFYRFRAEMHLQFHLKWVNLNEGDTEAPWRYLRISKLDTRRIQVLIPMETPLVHAVSLGKDSISAEQMYDNWLLRDKLHVNFLSLQGPGGVDAQNGGDEDGGDERNDDADDVDHDEDFMVEGVAKMPTTIFQESADGDESTIEMPAWLLDGGELPSFEEGEQDASLVEVEPEPELTALPEERKRFLSARQAHIVLRSISIGCFCRLLRINVDSNGRIRPLVDPGPDHDFDLLNFFTFFVDDGSGSQYDVNTKVQLQDYLPRLGETIQRHVFPHPIRTYDVATLYLIICTGGGLKRSTRKGLVWLEKNITTAADFLINSIVLRILGKTHPLKCWCSYSRSRLGRTGTWFLPGVREIDDFLGFVKKAIAKTGNGKRRRNECHDFTSGQFLRTLDDQFKSYRGLVQVLTHWKLEAKSFLQDFTTETNNRGASTTRELFIRKMSDVFVKGGCSENGEKLKFVCSQVCADMEELIDEDPFGQIVDDVCSGPGSKAGYAVWKRKEQHKYFEELQKSTNNELEMQGLERGPKGVRVTLNLRYFSKVDLEHAGCKIGVYVPKLPGGGGSVSVQPRKQAPHCHPSCLQTFEEGISHLEIQEINNVAKKSVQAFKRAIFDDKWEDPGGIMGEKCWSRPANYLPVE